MSERPYTVCHILSSLDGKIDGSFMSAPETALALRAYADIRGQYDCAATVYGTITMIEGYADGLAPVLPEQSRSLPRTDRVADAGAGHYIVSVDPKGTLGFRSNTIEKKGRPKAHIIQVLTEQVSDRYIAYLREKDVSYIFAGADSLDCTVMVKKLKSLFDIQRLMLAGGGVMDWSFAQEGLIDELSIVLAPVADGDRSGASLFESAGFYERERPAAFSLLSAERRDGGVLWLRYRKKNKE